MKKVILFTVLLCMGSLAFSHSESASLDEIKLVESSELTKPEVLRGTSVQLLETRIGSTQGNHGTSYFFETADTKDKRLVNQGFAMLNVFQYTDAFRSFNEALSENPKSVEAYIGRAFASISLDGQEPYYLVITRDFLLLNKEALSPHQKAWADLLLAKITGAGTDEWPLTVAQAYAALKEVNPENPEVKIFANWVSEAYELESFKEALSDDPTNAGAVHYILHLAEMRGDHDTALRYGEMLSQYAPGSGHGQHMYGHVLPHFNRWNEADQQFRIAHGLHIKWAQTNRVHPAEDWHYAHNLDLWSVTSMVLNPARAVLILEELSSFNVKYVPDLLDLQTASGINFKTADDKIKEYENRSSEWSAFVSTSRMLHILLSSVEEFESVKSLLITDVKEVESRKQYTIFLAVKLIEATKSGDVQLQEDILQIITGDLSKAFVSGGFDGWRSSVLETIVYTRIFEAYGLEQASKVLMEKVTGLYINPVD